MSVTTIYKCIPFSACYWPYIENEGRIRFATIPELWTGNDKEEFNHRWDSKSQFFKRFEDSLKPHFESLFSKTVILSVGKSPTKECWEEYCKNGGVRYEFEYDSSVTREASVNCDHVLYDDEKIFNLPGYITAREPDLQIKRLLQVEVGLNWCGWFCLWKWLQTRTPNRTSLKFIYEEIAFKKMKKFRFEDEYRFVHVTQQVGPHPLKLELKEQKSFLNELGLKLIRISTSDVDEVKKKLPNCSVEISHIYFR